MQQETIPEFREFQCVRVARPYTVPELSEVVVAAQAKGQAIFPLGGRTMLGLGLPPSKPGIGVDLRALDQVIEYPARDMTITVQAGITIANLQAILAAENQQLPVDVPFPEQATLGGAIAVNASGPRRYGYGTLRDYVIGISFINGEGQVVKAGGRVVKNVAGYDLMKLHIGALGTLGIVTQVTLKLRPRTEGQAIAIAQCRSAELDSLLNNIHGSLTRPACIDILNCSAVRAFGQRGLSEFPWPEWVAFIGLENNHVALRWQVEQIVKNLPGCCDVRAAPLINIWSELCDFPIRSAAKISFRLNVRPSATGEFCQLVAGLSERTLLQAHAGNGIILGHADDLTLDQARTMLTTLLDATGPDGNLIVTRCPTEWKRELPVWGKPRGDYWLMRRVKEALDPRGIFNPGRFVDGI